MKLNISRFSLIAVAALFSLVAGSTYAAADCADSSPNFVNDFTSGPNCLTLNGNGPSFQNSPPVLQLTPSAGNQVAAVWFNTPQTVTNGFSTTFQFQFTNPSTPPADGIAFVIQNTGTAAIGSPPNGGALGYGDSDTSVNPSSGVGIPDSLAIEIDTFINGWDSGNANHVAIQSCGQGGNTSHHHQLCGGTTGSDSTLGFFPVTSPIFSAGATHSLTITYNAVCTSCTPAVTAANLHVILDNTELTPTAGIQVDLGSLLNLGNNTAFVGFTGATGGNYETQNILNWTFTPASQSKIVTTGTTTTFPLPGPQDDFTALLTKDGEPPTTMQVKEIPISLTDCNTLVHSTFTGAQCFIWKNQGSPVLLAVTCPQLQGGTCGNETTPNFFADLGVDFRFDPASNPGFVYNAPPTIAPPGNPRPGWVKFEGNVDPGDPCDYDPNNLPTLHNQIETFFADADPAHLKGGSGGTASCWTPVYNIPNEDPTVDPIVAPVNGGTYTLGQNDSTTKASYTCEAVNNPANDGGKTGPFITVVSCSGPVATGAQFDTSTAGSHTFTVNVTDSVDDIAARSATYTVSQAGSTTNITSHTPNPSVVGQSVTVNVTVTAGVGPGPTGNVTIAASGTESCVAVLSGGAGSCSLILTAPGTRTLTASYLGDSNYLGSSASVSQTVNTVPQATVSPSSIDFGTLYLGSIGTRNVTVTSTGSAPLLITGPFLSLVKGGDSSEFVELNLCPKSLAVGKSCTITVAFLAGPFYTLQTTTLQIKDNAPDSPQLVPLKALVINPRATPSVSSLSFGNQTVNTTSAAKTVTIKNTGATTLNLGTFTTSSNFAVSATGTTCVNGGTLAPTISCQIAVTFTPTAKVNYSGTLTINDNAQNSPQKVSLSGKGN